MNRKMGIAARVPGGMVFTMSGSAAHTTAAESPRWQLTTEWHSPPPFVAAKDEGLLLRKSVRGTWFLEVDGVEIRSAKFHERSGYSGYVDIRSFGLSLKELTQELWPAEIRIKRVRQP